MARAPGAARAAVTAGLDRSVAARRPELQLATLVDTVPRGPGWLFEIKYDGWRALATKKGRDVVLRSRGGLPYAGLAAIRARIGALRCEEVVLDGELCGLDDAGRPRFEALQAALSSSDEGALVYFVFDVLSLDGQDLRPDVLATRKRVLERLVRTTDRGPLRRAPVHTADGTAFLEATRALELEGVVAKRADRPHRAGRSLEWQKIKTDGRAELVVVGFTPPSGSRRGFGALLLGAKDGGALRYAGKVGAGLDERALASLHRQLERLEVDTPAVVDPPKMRGVHWTAPELVVEVRYSEWTRDGRLRHPVFLGLRTDKPARDVVRERAVRSGR